MLLTADAAAYSAVVRRRWKAAAVVALVCCGLASVIIYFEYRLMVIAFVVAFPAFVPVLDAVMVGRSARAIDRSAEVRLEGALLTVKPGVVFEVGRLVNVRVQPDLVVMSERYGPGPRSIRGWLVPASGDKAQAFIARLEASGVNVVHEKATMVALVAFFWGFMANMLLDLVAGVLVLATVVTAAKNLFDGKGPGWDAGAYLGGALLALTARALIQLFAIEPAKEHARQTRDKS